MRTCLTFYHKIQLFSQVWTFYSLRPFYSQFFDCQWKYGQTYINVIVPYGEYEKGRSFFRVIKFSRPFWKMCPNIWMHNRVISEDVLIKKSLQALFLQRLLWELLGCVQISFKKKWPQIIIFQPGNLNNNIGSSDPWNKHLIFALF